MGRIGSWVSYVKPRTKILQWSNYTPERRGSDPTHIIMSFENGRWHYLTGYGNKIYDSFKTKQEAKNFAYKIMRSHPNG